ncbi:MAG: DegV family protein [Lachnospiraceae bacterium]
MKIKIVSDSSCDMLQLDGVNFESVPLTISTDQHDYEDDANLNLPDMLSELAGYRGSSHTACPGPARWLQAFEDADVVYVTVITSNLSGTYNAAMNARDLYLQTHPQAKVHVFDTLSTGPEMRLLLEKIAELVKQGREFEEIVAAGNEYLTHTRLFFSLESLHNMAQNGRVNPLIASAIGVIGLRIVGTASVEGTLQPLDKCRGEKKVRTVLLKYLKEIGYHGGKVRISHVENLNLAVQIKQDIETAYEGADVLIYSARGLCSYYAERGGVLLGCEY